MTDATSTLFAAGSGAPKQLAQTRSGADGRFALRAGGAPGTGEVLYVVAKGGTPAAKKSGGNNPVIALMSVLEPIPPKSLTINELTTVASVFTAAQFINGESISGNPDPVAVSRGSLPTVMAAVVRVSAMRRSDPSLAWMLRQHRAAFVVFARTQSGPRLLRLHRRAAWQFSS